ncbi:orotate phosphoribosyltransferase [Hapalosiphon sp. MRB220]|nr:orotate phosphoribosyltransferase [Hapalosiphon sp. MRB220]
MYNQLDETTRAWGMACHLSALGGFIIPFGSVLIPLIIWLTQKEKHQFIDEQGKESVNFQISLIIYILALCFILIFLTLLLSLISGLLSEENSFRFLSIVITLQVLPVFVFVAILLFQLIMVIIAAVRAYNGQSYRYPFNLRLLK